MAYLMTVPYPSCSYSKTCRRNGAVRQGNYINCYLDKRKYSRIKLSCMFDTLDRENDDVNIHVVSSTEPCILITRIIHIKQCY